MAVKLKSSAVKIEEFSVSLCHIFSKLEEVHRLKKSPQPENLVITSINDGIHKSDSKHYKNQAVDIRSKSFKDELDKVDFVTHLMKALGPKFSLIYEHPGEANEHFHIQVKKGQMFP